MFNFFKKKERKIAKREQQIQAVKQEFHRQVNARLEKQEKVNSVLGNGITLEIYHATHGSQK